MSRAYAVKALSSLLKVEGIVYDHVHELDWMDGEIAQVLLYMTIKEHQKVGHMNKGAEHSMQAKRFSILFCTTGILVKSFGGFIKLCN